ncbi:DUF6789 family protein [Botryobacter ruber]|uniref:DUF6789 family protein n=1 Tax=Botryobacter ruber TaxID=2171629 RepID=UPI000E0A8DC3|nr:DUF6789 family protein [Botryobacter ruber]
MKLLYAILAGLAGTAAMTAFLYLLTYATHRVMKTAKTLGTMLLDRTQPDGGLADDTKTRTVGTIAHFVAGIVFAIGYLALWNSEVGAPTASWGVFLGFANGILAMIIWYFFFMIHTNPPYISLKSYLVTLIFAHIIFGFVVSYVFYSLLQPRYTFWQ